MVVVNDIFDNALKKAVSGGISGASAMGIQIGSLMWLRTTMNYQFKNGGKLKLTLKKLYSDGGIPRFYRGVLPALMIGPISRFGDTAMNDGVLTLFDSYHELKNIPIAIQTGCASVMAGLWRISIIPIDAWKTSKQVHGKDGLNILKKKINISGKGVLYHGAIASSAATMIGHYPWFLTYNYMNNYLPKYKYEENPLKALGRNALIGFSASLISDTVSNSIRVVKTIKQTNEKNISYRNVIERVIEKDGFNGLFLRGLKTKILTNGLQGIVFSISWKYISEKLNK